MKGGKTGGSKLSYCLKAPIRVLSRVRDFYVRSMTSCAGQVHYGSTGLPKSFSVSSSQVSEDEDMRELMRALSQRSQAERMEAAAMEGMRSKRLPKSFSAGIGRIDEDKPCDFQEDDFKVKSDLSSYPRSKSYAVTKKNRILV